MFSSRVPRFMAYRAGAGSCCQSPAISSHVYCWNLAWLHGDLGHIKARMLPGLNGNQLGSVESAAIRNCRVLRSVTYCSNGEESRCGAVALGRAYLLPPLSSGGALLVQPWLRFHIPLIEPDRQISRIRLSDKTSRLRFRVQRHLQLLNIIGVDRFPNLHVLHHVLRLS